MLSDEAKKLAIELGLYTWCGSIRVMDGDKVELILAAFAAIRSECAKVAENFHLEAGDPNQITLSGFVGRRIAEMIRTAQPAAINVPGLGRLTESPEGEWTDEPSTEGG